MSLRRQGNRNIITRPRSNGYQPGASRARYLYKKSPNAVDAAWYDRLRVDALECLHDPNCEARQKMADIGAKAGQILAKLFREQSYDKVVPFIEPWKKNEEMILWVLEGLGGVNDPMLYDAWKHAHPDLRTAPDYCWPTEAWPSTEQKLWYKVAEKVTFVVKITNRWYIPELEPLKPRTMVHPY
ncbi:MAG: hypothetical protein ACE5FT_03115 [Candidatus Nanoarchaeia archaeon]